MSIIGTLLGLFTGASWITKLVTVGVLAVTILSIYGGWHAHVYRKGYDAALRAVAAQNKKAIARAQEYRGRVVDCDARELRWDQSTGECR